MLTVVEELKRLYTDKDCKLSVEAGWEKAVIGFVGKSSGQSASTLKELEDIYKRKQVEIEAFFERLNKFKEIVKKECPPELYGY